MPILENIITGLTGIVETGATAIATAIAAPTIGSVVGAVVTVGVIVGAGYLIYKGVTKGAELAGNWIDSKCNPKQLAYYDAAHNNDYHSYDDDYDYDEYDDDDDDDYDREYHSRRRRSRDDIANDLSERIRKDSDSDNSERRETRHVRHEHHESRKYNHRPVPSRFDINEYTVKPRTLVQYEDKHGNKCAILDTKKTDKKKKKSKKYGVKDIAAFERMIKHYQMTHKDNEDNIDWNSGINPNLIALN